MKTLSFSNIPSIDFNFDDRDNRTQQQKNYEYSLQALSNLMASDDFDGVREQLVKDEAQAYENEYMQAAANNLTKGKTTVQDTVKVIDSFVEADNSPAVSLEKKTSETLLSELAADYPEVYAKYINNPEQFTKDTDSIANFILTDEMYRRYSESYANTKHLLSVGAEVVSSIGASWLNLGAPYEGAKQAYKLNKLKDIVDFNEDIITPTALGHNLRTVIYKNAREMSPTEFKKFLDKFEEAIKDIPSVYQQEILEWTFEGYQPVDNLFMVSDIEDLGKIGKAIQNFNKPAVQKKVGNMTKALDDIIVREEEALSATAKADVTEATVAKNNKRVKKDVVKKVVKEEVEKSFENVDAAPETSEVAFATQLTEAKHIDEVSDATPKSVIDHKNWADQNATLIGRVDGTPFATYEEAARAARDIMLGRIAGDGKQVVSAWSRSNFEYPKLEYINSGEGTQIEGRGIYATLQRPETTLNSSKNYEVEFREFLPKKSQERIKKGFKGFKTFLKRNYKIDYIEDDFNFDKYLTRVQKDFSDLRRDGLSVRRSINTLKNRYMAEFKEGEDFLYATDAEPEKTAKTILKETVQDSDTLERYSGNFLGSAASSEFDDRSSYLVLEYLTKGVPLHKEPVNKFFIFDQKGYKYLNEDLITGSEEDDLIKNYAVLEQILNVFKKYEILMDDNGDFFHTSDYRNTFGTPFREVSDLGKNFKKEQRGLAAWLYQDNVWNVRDMEFALAAKLEFDNPGKHWDEYYKEASEILMNETDLGGAWHSNVNVMSYREDSFIPFYTESPIIKDGKVSYQRRLDNPELLKYYTEPVQVNNQWYVKTYNNDVDLIKIKGN